MNERSGSSRRVQGILATVAGAALLLGGSTYALWTAQADIDGRKITAGDLNIEAGTFAAYDVSSDRKDATTEVVEDSGLMGHAVTLTAANASNAADSDWRIVPGDTLAMVFPYTVTLQGDNLVAEMKLNINSVLDDFDDVAGQLDFKYRLFQGTTEITSAPTAIPANDTTPLARIASNDADKGSGAFDKADTDLLVVDADNELELTYVLLITFKASATDRENVGELADLSDALTATLTQIRTAGVGQFGTP